MIEAILIGLLISGGIGAAAYRVRALSLGGVIGAMLLGTLTWTAGLPWALSLIAFFISSSLLSRVGEQRKVAARENFSKGEKRDFMQVAANGGVAGCCALAYLLSNQGLWWVLYLGALAAVTADTWGTEIGTLAQGQPRLITTGRQVAAGTSGAITWQGSGGGALGAALIALAGVWGGVETPLAPTAVFVGVLLAGMGGSFLDSFLGATVQALYWCEDRQKLTEKKRCKDGQPAQLKKGYAWITNEVVNWGGALGGSAIAGLAVLVWA